MRLTKRRRATTAEMNMTPMIDIVFLLIIFFMTVSQISAVNNERVELPKLKGSEDQMPSVMTINVTDEQKIIVSGEELSLTQLIAAVSEELVRVDDDPNRLNVVIRGDQRGRSQTANEIITALGRLRVNRVRFAVEKD